MNDYESYMLLTVPQVEQKLSSRVKELRLEANWKQSTLSERSGVSLGSLRRFEATGQISLRSLLKLCWALGRLDDFTEILQPSEFRSLKELEEQSDSEKRQRGQK